MSKVTQVLTTKTTIDRATRKSDTKEVWINADIPVDVGSQNIPNDSTLNDLNNITSDAPWYILYWIEQYNSLPKNIKDSVRQSTNHVEYLKDFSESIAALLNVEFIKDNSTVPVSDIGNNISAYTYSRVLDFVLTQESVDLHTEMSIKTNNIFKLNMTWIKDDGGVPSKLSTDSHGRNLITDSQHYVRMASIVQQLEQLIEQKLGVMYKVLQFIQSNIDVTRYYKWKSRINVEDVYRLVDLFGNHVENTGEFANRQQNDIDNTRLNTQEIPVS